MRSCKTCKFWRKIHPTAANVDGECRRNPPQLVGSSERPWSAWPRTGETDSCGEWVEREREARHIGRVVHGAVDTRLPLREPLLEVADAAHAIEKEGGPLECEGRARKNLLQALIYAGYSEQEWDPTNGWQEFDLDLSGRAGT